MNSINNDGKEFSFKTDQSNKITRGKPLIEILLRLKECFEYFIKPKELILQRK